MTNHAMSAGGQADPLVLLPEKGNIVMYDLLHANFEASILVRLFGVGYKHLTGVLVMTEGLHHKARAWPVTQNMISWS